jgi:heme A synthase
MNPSLYNPVLHRSALLLVILAMVVIIGGAFITSTEVAARQPQSAVVPDVSEGVHRALAIGLIACTLGIAMWISYASAPGRMRVVAWSGVFTLVVDAVLGWQTPPLSPKVAVFHALLAHLFLSLSIVIAVGTSAGRHRERGRVDGSSRLLRPLAIAIPAIVFLQVTLGAAYRHDMTSFMPHITLAMGVAFLALIGSTVVLQNFPGPPPLRRAAAALIAIVLLQVSLGIGAFLMLVLNMAGNVYFVVTTVGHVLIGASTLAASVVLAIQVWRSVLPKQA